MELESLSLKDLAIYVSDILRENGIRTVLSGGACVSIYTDNKYLSYDLDFVLLSYEERKRVDPIMRSIGFQPQGRHFRHKDTPFLVEFLSPPLSIGGEPIKDTAIIRKGKRSLTWMPSRDGQRGKGWRPNSEIFKGNWITSREATRKSSDSDEMPQRRGEKLNEY
jgi:hypothetical protein